MGVMMYKPHSMGLGNAFCCEEGEGSIFEPTCAYARWAPMHHFLYVWMDVCDLTKIHILVRAWTWHGMENLEVDPGNQGQRSRSPGQKNVISGLIQLILY